jgi:hypothetical protein
MKRGTPSRKATGVDRRVATPAVDLQDELKASPGARGSPRKAQDSPENSRFILCPKELWNARTIGTNS